MKLKWADGKDKETRYSQDEIRTHDLPNTEQNHGYHLNEP
jgi:hypothetical protein